MNEFYLIKSKISTFVVFSIIAVSILVLFTGISFTQDIQTQKMLSPEDLIARENYIYTRRAGGPGMVIPQDVLSKALQQKALLPEDKNISNSVTSTVSWVSVNPIGLFYARTGSNYISGRTNSIAFHPTNPNIFYIAAAQGGVWKTTDGGVTWQDLTDNLSFISSGDIEVDQVNPNILYYGTGELNYSLDSHYGDGIFKSTDAGTTWTQIATGALVGTYISKIVITPGNSNILYSAGNAGVFKSTNAGINWVNTFSPTGVTTMLIDPTNTQVLYISPGSTGSGTVSKSTDGGTSWNPYVTGLASGRGRITLAMSDINPQVLYASVASASTSGLLGLYKTTDGAATWTLEASSPNYLGGQGWYDNGCCVKNGDPNTVITGGLDLYVSTNSGVTLVQKSSWYSTSSINFTHADIHFLTYHGSILYCLSDGGVYKSTDDGNSWTDLNHFISTLQYQSADYDIGTISKLYGGTQDNDKEYSTDGGANWTQRTTGDGGYTVVDPVNTNYVYGQYVNGSLERSANYGFSYTEVAPTDATGGGLFYNPYEMAPGDHNTIVFGRRNLWETNNAQTCTQSSGWTTICPYTTTGGNISAIGIGTQTINKIYMGTSNGRILVTTDGGSNWSTVTGFNYISDFTVDPTNDNICYASLGGNGGNRVLKTTDGGTTWNSISNGLPNVAMNTIILRATAPRMLFVGSDLGVFQTTNEGANWVSFNSGLPTMQVYDLKYKEPLGYILAATHGRGCWTFNLTQAIGIKPISSDIPAEYKLFQNYPNPFNPTTNIRYQLPKNSDVKIVVYDALGRQVATLVNENQIAGTYEIKFNGTNFSSGIYFYKLKAGEFEQTMKLILLK